MLPTVSSSDLVLLIGFVSTSAVLLYRVHLLEIAVKELQITDETDLVALQVAKSAEDAILKEHARRIERMEARVFNGGPK